MTINDLINLITNNGMGIACVVYTLYVNSIIMKEMSKTLSIINERLSVLEKDMEDIEKYVKG